MSVSKCVKAESRYYITSRKIQQASETEPKMPENASRAVNGMYSTSAIVSSILYGRGLCCSL
jgi:hypothetical protein